MKPIVIILLICSLLTGCVSVVTAVRDEPIEEDPKSRNVGTWVDDETIEFRAEVNLLETDPGFDEGHVVVVSHNGVVLLAGQVQSQQLRDLATEIVSKLKNVRKVHNELTVGPPIAWPARSNDNWITAKVKARLLFTDGIDSGAVTVTTEDGVVYLQGLVRRAEADAVVAAVQKSYGVQKIVRAFEYID